MIGLDLILGQADAWEYLGGIEAQFPGLPDCMAEETFPLTLAFGEEAMSVLFAQGEPVWTAARRVRATAAMALFSSGTALVTSLDDSVRWHSKEWIFFLEEETFPLSLCEGETISVGPDWISLPEGSSGPDWRLCAVTDPHACPTTWTDPTTAWCPT